MTAAPRDLQPPELQGPRPSRSVDARDPRAFVFGGVAFDVYPSPEVGWELGDEHRLFRSPFDTDPVFARLHCVIAAAPELADEFSRAIDWSWQGDVALVRTAAARAELRDLGGGAFVTTALVAPGDRGCSNLVTAVTGALADRVGGLVLHASGIEVDGGAVLFIGPSGAGKTTAANHCAGARWFARDRAIVYPTERGWYTTAMCGGDPVELERSSRSALPLRAILRVRRGEDVAVFRDLGLAEALGVLRESAQSVVSDAAAEGELLDRASRVHGESRVGELRSVLGQDLTPALREWVAA